MAIKKIGKKLTHCKGCSKEFTYTGRHTRPANYRTEYCSSCHIKATTLETPHLGRSSSGTGI